MKKGLSLSNKVNKVVLLPENVRPYTAKIVKNLLKEVGWKVLKHSPYSPDFTPSDHHLFRSLSHKLTDKKIPKQEGSSNFLQNFFNKNTSF